MATSTLTLPVDALSAARASFSKSPAASPNPSTRARHPNDQEAIEMDTLGTPKASSVASTSVAPEVPAWNMSPKKEWTAISTCFICLFLAGWNDATTGPLLPTIQAFYHVNFTVVSMLFVSNFVGFMSAAVANGRKSPVAGLNGISLQDAQANGFVAALPNNASAKMGFLHAAYGAGAFVAPLVATQFAQLPRWSFHYLTSLGLAVINAIALLVVFRLRPQDDSNVPTSTNEQNKYKQIFGSRAVQLMAFFIWVYVGTEVTIGGWIVTFVIEERGGGPSAGYVSRQVPNI
ncbi:hypothetical protein FRC06_010606 [Ceratobasidium sp. 370]|nr:hypothetical protein FRC06_010606 [Ceratobasidium sp. 370]